jgi:hypothetical protein
MSDAPTIPGYTLGTSAVPCSPISMAEFEQMKQSVLFGEDDVQALQMSGGVLSGQEEAILDVWYGFVGSVPHLLASFADRSSGAPLGDYLGAVRRRFGQWIRDTAAAKYDQAWLDYQYEIGQRHHRVKKNQTDGAEASPIVPFRDLFLLIFPVTHTLRPFLGAGGHAAAEVERMHQAWVKSCLLQVTLWSHPYVREGDF